MMRRLFLTLFVTLMACGYGRAGDYERYYQNLPTEVTPVAMFALPDNQVSLTDFGGIGDGVTLNTEAFRKAISALQKKGGGRLIVPDGVWLTGPISLKDSIDLHLERNAIIYFSPDKSLYVSEEGGRTVHCHAYVHQSGRTLPLRARASSTATAASGDP